MTSFLSQRRNSLIQHSLKLPKSDALSPKDLIAMSPVCKKCGEKMERKSVDKLESVIDSLFGMFRK